MKGYFRTYVKSEPCHLIYLAKYRLNINRNKREIKRAKGYLQYGYDVADSSLAYVTSLFVRLPYRGKGIGTNLLKEFLKEARKNGVKTIKLDCMDTQLDEGRNIYYKAGFRFVHGKEFGPEMIMHLK